MPLDALAFVIVPAWLVAAAVSGVVASGAGASRRRWFWMSVVAGPVGWLGAYVVARDARERVRPSPRARAALRRDKPPSRSPLLRLARSDAPFLESKNHGGV